jgi:23S rRNA (cytidine1920-2'-O)/16S rRNA (cytidine1409-2'-O)-methyltransferase
MEKVRLDVLLVERGLAESRSQAQRLVMAGQVRVDGEVILHSSASISSDVSVKVEHGPRFVSRGGEKLAAALVAFAPGVSAAGRVCADVGASTGGFTDCLLQNGAARVYAIDVGKGILDWKLRNDQRVVVIEGSNARFIDRLPEPVNLVTVDVSFISLKIILPVVIGWAPLAHAAPHLSVIALVKPQFEAGRQQVGRGKGVIRDPIIHRQVLTEVLEFSNQVGYAVCGLIRSPLTGPKGNTEFLAWLEIPGKPSTSIETMIDTVVPVID